MHKRMAWIQNGVVTNFIAIRPAQVLELETESARIADIGEENVLYGDTWDGERFYRDGVPLSELGGATE